MILSPETYFWVSHRCEERGKISPSPFVILPST